MDFCYKLDFLMNLTKTTNSMLAKQISMDASYISRLRTGDRTPAKKADYIRSMAQYFAKHCKDEPKTEALIAAVNKSVPEMAFEKTEELIYYWLSREEQDKSKPVGVFLNNLSNFSFKKMSDLEPVQNEKRGSKLKDKNIELFYGTEGKREAVVQFLNDIIEQETPRTLLLFSEENQDWLTERREFTVKWSSLLQQVIRHGNKIKIIHSISRNLDEMLTAIAGWLPIYMTGMVEPYYYPKMRDGIFQRTLFIAPGLEAVLSTSVTGRIESTANYLIRDKRAVKAAVVEFDDYFELCRPLINVFNTGRADRHLKTFDSFIGEKANTIIKTDALSIMTMPESVLNEALGNLSESEAASITNNYHMMSKHFESAIREYQYHEIIRIPDLEDIQDGRLRLAAAEFLGRSDIYYSVLSYKQHLEHILMLLKQHKNYNVYISEERNPDGVIIGVKEDVGVMVSKTTTPPIMFTLQESRMTAAFWDYLAGSIGKELGSADYKEQIIEKLETILKRL